MKGAAFIIQPANPDQMFIPEEWSEEQIMMAESILDFMAQEVHPILDELDSMNDPTLMPMLLEKSGEMGFTGLSIPEAYGGLNLDFNTGLLFGEVSASGFCFATSLGAQTSIGSLPIAYYGTEAQKEKYLPGIATGQLKAAYCLTEPSAGSDANSGKTRATPTEDGKFYLLNGQKMWITNGGFADIFIVFAKIEEDENLSAFIVEKTFGGIELGAEEKKLGIKGSSTVQVFFNNCPVPAENLLGERQEGFKIALNILNSGRAKLASGSIGGSKMAIDRAVKYANERKQFDQPIGKFGAIQFKLAEMACRTFATESAVYNIGRAIDIKADALKAEGKPSGKAMLEGIREYVVECALMKVHGSEVLDYCVDETLQIFGGMGYSAEMGVERAYRDARITRIYEGTSEINRMLAVGELFKKAFKDKVIDIVAPVKKLPFYLIQNFFTSRESGIYGREKRHIKNLKMVFLMLAASAGNKFKLKLIDEQEIIINLSDMLSEAYVAECVWARLEKLKKQGKISAEELHIKEKMAAVYLFNAIEKVKKSGREAIMSYATGTSKTFLLRALKALTKSYPINPKSDRRAIAEYLLKADGYPFSSYKMDVAWQSAGTQLVHD